MANYSGRFFSNNSLYKLLELVEVRDLIDRNSLKTYWCESTFELFIYKTEGLLDVISYTEDGYLFVELAYPKHSKNCNLDHLYFEVYEQSIQRGQYKYQGVINNLYDQDSVIGDIKSQALFLSLIEAIEYFSKAFFDESYCTEIFSSISSSEGLSFVQDRVALNSNARK